VSDTRPGGPGGQRATYRGVRWRRDEQGTPAWFNDGLGRWVRWRPGADAPPLPPRWATGDLPAPPDRPVRARWRSPYRIVPVVFTLVVVGIGVYQATKSTPDPVRSEARAAEALLGRCLAQNGTAGGRPRYAPSPVSCRAPYAAVKVFSVLAGTPGGPPCPPATASVQLGTPGVRYPHIECVTAVHPHA
jgi:hypothetical protein